MGSGLAGASASGSETGDGLASAIAVALRLCGWLRNKFMIVAEALQELDTNRVESWNVSSIVF